MPSMLDDRHSCAQPRVVIAGERSGVGKSTITIGVLAALRARGLTVQPFKAGPDFLDPMHHNVVVERISRNLDTWMFPKYVQESFQRAALGADISVIEGVMGLYDGYDGSAEEGSTAHLSKVLRSPVILVLDASASARSVGAVALGFKEYDPEVRIAGVIFNNVGGPRHLRMLESSLRGVDCLGGIPNELGMSLESRHLGLVPAQERADPERYAQIRDRIEEHVDLPRVIEIARSAPELPCSPLPSRNRSTRCRIGVARDAAFNFYYEDNFDILGDHGAEIVPFSPLTDRALPEVDGLYFGGGYPEIFASQLSENRSMLDSVRAFSGSERPVYAECGGLMYLCTELKDLEGSGHRMTGIFDAQVEMTERLQALAYVEAKVLRDNILSKRGWSIRGHVFHFSRVTEAGEGDYAYDLGRESGIQGSRDGFCDGSALASYAHLHFGANQDFAARWVERCYASSRR
jgi:cobyrinic acid a,c-diamide synthase